MVTFLIGLVILCVGGMIYGRFTERIMKPTDAATPAVSMKDGRDYVPMKRWRNSLIELLNIAGTGPILGPIQGILFGPIAFITIPIGCVIGGAFHDYMTGMISVRNKGGQMPELVREFLGKHLHRIYLVFVCLMMLLLGVVFIYTPGDLFVTHILKQDASYSNPITWVVYGAIFAYYIVATQLPIDKLIGKIYPVFGAILLLSAVGVFIGLFFKGYPLVEIWDAATFGYPMEGNFFPLFFVTVACGICSGFHSTQATLVSRTITSEKEGRGIFYDMMLMEGFIAMIWAAAGMAIMQAGIADADTLRNHATDAVGIISIHTMGDIGGLVAIFGVIILPITSGDTALRSLRLMVGEALNIDQTKKKNSIRLALVIFLMTAGVLVWSKINPDGFRILWQYFSWANEVTAVFAFSMITMYMKRKAMPYLMALLPGSFYMYMTSAYILHAKIGFNLSWTYAYIFAGVLTLAYALALILVERKPENRPQTV